MKSFWKSFLINLGSFSFIFSSPSYKKPKTINETLAQDWHNVGDDMRKAMNKYDRTIRH